MLAPALTLWTLSNGQTFPGPESVRAHPGGASPFGLILPILQIQPSHASPNADACLSINFTRTETLLQNIPILYIAFEIGKSLSNILPSKQRGEGQGAKMRPTA